MAATSSKSAEEFKAEVQDVANLPYGQCLVNEKWRKSKIMEQIQKNFQVHFTTETDFVDFQPSSSHLITLLDESEIISGLENVQRRLARLYKLAHKNPRSPHNPVAVYHSTDLTAPYFYQVQNLCVLEFSIPIIPVDTIDQIPQLLERFKVSTRLKNPFRGDRLPGLNLDKEMVLTLMNIPNIGEKAARSLLGRFGCVRGVAGATEPELCDVVGPKIARGLVQFFTRRSSV